MLLCTLLCSCQGMSGGSNQTACCTGHAIFASRSPAMYALCSVFRLAVGDTVHARCPCLSKSTRCPTTSGFCWLHQVRVCVHEAYLIVRLLFCAWHQICMLQCILHTFKSVWFKAGRQKRPSKDAFKLWTLGNHTCLMLTTSVFNCEKHTARKKQL